MDTGTKISAIAHVSLIGVALFGGTFRSEPLPMAVQDVTSMVSVPQFTNWSLGEGLPKVPEVALSRSAVLVEPTVSGRGCPSSARTSGSTASAPPRGGA